MSLEVGIKEILEDAVKKGEIAGGNVLLIHQGEEIAYTQAGYKDVKKQLPYERDTIFRMYSMTKPVTGAATMLLFERGKLDLDTPVSAFLPGFKGQKVRKGKETINPTREVVVGDLLSMTSGLPYPDANGEVPFQQVAKVFEDLDKRLGTSHQMTTQELANRLGECELCFDPGDQWLYGTSADILAAIIETVEEISYGEFLEREFFQPLEMTDTGFYVPKSKRDRLAQVYQSMDDGSVQLQRTCNLGIDYELIASPGFESGGAGLVSTIDDYSKFASMLLKGGSYKGKTYLHPATVTHFTSSSLMPWQQESFSKGFPSLLGYTYGNLLRILKDPTQANVIGSVGEYGWDGWLGAYFCNLPKEDLTILLSTQRIDAGTLPVTRKIRNLALSALKRV